MTKEELAKKKGIKLDKEKKSPSDALLTTMPVENKEEPVKKGEKKNADDSKKRETRTEGVKENKPKQIEAQQTEAVVKEVVQEIEMETPVIKETIKRGPGKPKKRKDGDKKISFWLDEDLVGGLYGSLSYGESAGELINTAVREYQKKHSTYKP